MFNAQPRAAGIPEQIKIDGSCVALWYSDGSTGVMRSWRCALCDGTGLTPPSGLGDVQAAEEWTRRTGVDLPEPSHSEVRGFVIRRGDRRETDQAAGELSVFSDTSLPRKANTGTARC